MDRTESSSTALQALAEVLEGSWRVTGPDIRGTARYESKQDGALLVGFVEVHIGDSRMANIQHIALDEASGMLQARYLDTYGDEAVYTWELDGKQVRVSLAGPNSDSFFVATLNGDNSEYSGSWHGPGLDPADMITYTRTQFG